MKKILISLTMTMYVFSTFATGLSVSITLNNNATCYGDCNGSATAVAEGGSGSYSYVWSGPAGYTATGATATNMCAGQYTVTVTDSNDMSTATANIIITQPDAISSTFTYTKSQCGSGSSTVNFTNTGSSGSEYSYSWTFEGGTPASSTAENPSVNYPVLGNFNVIHTVSNGTCSSSITETISIYNILLNFNYYNCCYTICSGMANVHVNGGVSPYSYLWSNSEITSQVSELCPGSYTVTVTDLYGCTGTDSVSIIQLPPLTVSFNSNGLSCGNCNGTATCQVSGGTPPYSYTWSNMTTIPTVTNLCPGTYNVTVMDAMGCTNTGMVQITASSGFTYSASTTPANCSYSSGAICIQNIMGGVSPYTYHWSNYATDSCISNLYAGNYYCTVSDANGCQTDTAIHLQNVNSISVVLDSLININCANHNDFGSIYIHANSGMSPYTYIWSHGATTPAITNLNAGTYTITAIDNQGCSNSMTFYIQNTYNLYASITTTNANCINNNGTATVTAYGVHPPFSYLWSDSLHQTTSTANHLSSDYYFVTVTDNIGCTIIAHTYIHFFNSNVIKGRIYMDDNQNCIQDNGELGISNHFVKVLPANNYSYTNASGDYILYTNQLNNYVTVSNYYSDGNFPTCPSNSVISVNFTTSCGDTSYNNNFGYYYNPNYFNLRISPSWNSAYPGFNKTYKLYGYNNSATTQNATLRLTYDTALQYISSNFNGVYNSTLHTVEWTANNISPYSYVNNNHIIPEATFYVPTTVSITDTLCALFEIFPTTGDIYPFDNSVSMCNPVTGSYDPNSKEVFPTGQGVKGYITTNDSVLFYTIHFQNTGNDTCFTVEITDTLSSYLEPASIEMGASSHPCTTTLKGTGVLSFRFDNILLPDSNSSPDESSGFVNYMVHLKPNLTLGTVINNTAYIVFDFNAPVATNTTVNTITSLETIADRSNHKGIDVYPNPFKNFTTFNINDFHQGEKYSIEIFDMLGKSVLLFENINTKTFNVYSTHLESGIYFYKVSSPTTEIAVGKISVE